MRLQTFFDYLSDFEFFIKITLACVVFQWFFFYVLSGIELTLFSKIVIYWLVNVASYYIIAFLIEKVIKKNKKIARSRNTRNAQIKSQPYQRASFKRFLLNQLQLFVVAAGVILLLHEVEREVNFFWNSAWFFMSIVITDFAFYAHHNWFLHHRRFIKIHAKHHSYRDTSGFVTGYKSFSDLVINFVLADMVVLILFGFDFYQLLAWTVVLNLFNIEGHSAISLFFIGSDFHDRHHTHYRGNYGVQGLWDKIFGTFISTNRKTGLFFPANTLGHYLIAKQKTN